MKFFSSLLLFILALSFIFSPIYVKAAPLTNFGGVIIGARPCETGRNWILYILDKRGFILPLTFQPGVSILYKMYQPRPVVNAIGSFIPGDVCDGFSAVGTILQIGTSLTVGP